MDRISQSSEPSNGSSKAFRAKMITRQVMCLFSAYRRDDFADPEGFVVQLGAILERYPDSVIGYVTSPHTGLQRRLKFPPSIAEVVEACDAEEASQKRIEALRKVRPVERKALPKPPADPRKQANVFIPEGFVHYDAMVERHEGEKDAFCWYETRECSDKVTRNGIWAPFSWTIAPAPAKKKGLKLFTAEEIIDRYKPQPKADEPVTEAAE